MLGPAVKGERLAFNKRQGKDAATNHGATQPNVRLRSVTTDACINLNQGDTYEYEQQ